MKKIFMFSLILSIALIQTFFPGPVKTDASSNEWWNRKWYYRVPVVVSSQSEVGEALITVSLKPKEILSKLRVNGTFDFNSIRVIGLDNGDLKELPFNLNFENESLVENFEKGIDKWKLKPLIITWLSNESVGGGKSLCFRKATRSYISIYLPVDVETLEKQSIVSFWGKGNYTATLKDLTMPIELGHVEVSSSKYQRHFFYYDKRKISRKRPYGLFISPKDYVTVNYLDEIAFSKEKVTISWLVKNLKSGEERKYYIYFDIAEHGAKEGKLHMEIKGPKANLKASIGEPEGFRVVIEEPKVKTLTGNVTLKVKTLDNLSNIANVTCKLNCYGKCNSGTSLKMKPSREGFWVTTWNTAETVGDGLQKVSVRAVETDGRESYADVYFWVRNVQFKETVNLKPNTTTFRFAVIGDNRPGSAGDPQPEIFLQILKAINKVKPDMVFNTGDIVYSGDLEQYIDFKRVTSILRKPMYIARGNHEVMIGAKGQENYEYFFGDPYYSFNYGNSHFIILNANIIGHLYSVDEQQISWLKRDLERSKSFEHIFVFIHQPIYPFAHGLENKAVEATLREIMLKYHVTAVFQGHEHMCYIKEINSVKSIITGGAGAELDPQYPSKTLFFHFTMVQVNGSKVDISIHKPLVLEVINPKGNRVVTDKNEIKIEGRTQPFAELIINGEKVDVKKTGYFSHSIHLSKGMNKVSVKSKFSGEEIERELLIIYKPPIKVLIPEEIYSEEKIKLTVTSEGKPVNGALVMLGDIKASTNLNGETEIKIPPIKEEKETVLLVTKMGYSDYVAPIKIKVSMGIKGPLQTLILVAITIVAVSLFTGYKLRSKRKKKGKTQV